MVEEVKEEVEFTTENITKEDIENINKTDPKKFIVSQEQIDEEAFKIAANILEGTKDFSEEHAKIIVGNHCKLHATLAGLLLETDYSRYWKQ